MEIKELITSGALSDVYVYGDSNIIKLYRNKKIDEVLRYYNKALIMNNYALPIPKAIRMSDEKGRQGIVFSSAKGENLLDITLDTKDAKYCGIKLAMLHKKIYTTTVTNLPSYKEEMLRRIDESIADDIYKAKARTLLEMLPDGNNLCHGDFHPGNIMSNKGRMMIIDWDNACIGPKEFDIAMTFVILNTSCFVEKGLRARNIRELTENIFKVYLKELGIIMSDIEKYFYICFVARYTSHIDEKTEKNLKNYLEYVK